MGKLYEFAVPNLVTALCHQPSVAKQKRVPALGRVQPDGFLNQEKFRMPSGPIALSGALLTGIRGAFRAQQVVVFASEYAENPRPVDHAAKSAAATATFFIAACAYLTWAICQNGI